MLEAMSGSVMVSTVTGLLFGVAMDRMNEVDRRNAIEIPDFKRTFMGRTTPCRSSQRMPDAGAVS